MNPNIQKLIQCYWKKPVTISGKVSTYRVQYFILYERKEHVKNQVFREYQNPNGEKWHELISHSDDLDGKIIDSLVKHFCNDRRIDGFCYSPKETLALLNNDIEELQKALLSQRAVGWKCRPLSVRNITTGKVKQLNTIIHFLDPQLTHEYIHPDLPFSIDLENVDDTTFDSLISIPFMDRKSARSIIEKHNPPFNYNYH